MIEPVASQWKSPGSILKRMPRLLVPTTPVIAASVAFLVALACGGESDRDRLGGAGHGVQAGRVAVDSVRAIRLQYRAVIDSSETYLPQVLSAGDSVLKRWLSTTVKPIVVFMAHSSDVPGYTPAHREIVIEAFNRWERLSEVPLRFAITNDSADAAVVVVWRERFPGHRTGQTEVRWDPQGWLLGGVLTLATRTSERWNLSADAIYTVALHEIGHLIGLAHSDDPDDLMYHSTTVHDLTARDRRTVELLYALPPGSLRDPAGR